MKDESNLDQFKSEVVEVVEFDPEKAKQFRQSNALIEATYKVTLTQKRLIITTISMIRPEDEDFKEYKIDINKFADTFEIKGKSVFDHVRKATEGLLSSVLRINDGNELLQTNWISSARYTKGSPFVIIRLDPSLKKHLLQLHLRGGYTKGFLQQAIYLNSINAIRFYELFVQYVPIIKKREFTLPQIKHHLGIKENEYPSYGHFKDRVLNRAIYELNSVTNLEIDWPPEDESEQKTYEIKEGKKVKGIVFSIREKSSIAHVKTLELDPPEFEEKTKSEGIQPHSYKRDFDKPAKQKKVFIIPTREEFKEFCDKYILSKNWEIIYDGYNEAGWKDSHGNEIKNWKQKLLQVWVTEKKFVAAESTGSVSASVTKSDPEAQNLLSSIRVQLGTDYKNDHTMIWNKFFMGKAIEKTGAGYTIYVTNPEALNYQEFFDKFKTKIEIKNA